MSFIENLDADPPPPDAQDPDEAVIESDWFPAIDPAALRKKHRIRDAVTASRFRDALIAAMMTVGNDLAEWRAAQPYDSLADVPALQIDGESRLVRLYVRAVALFAKAEIIERYRDIDITGPGERRAEELEPSIGDLRRDAAHAVRDILGRTRTSVELI